MSPPLLETKFFPPGWGSDLVSRPRLSRLLDEGADWKLALVSAPAGFGKTTLLAEWLASRPGRRSAAWLSLDAGDDDSSTFWTYVVAALGKAVPGLGDRTLTLLGEGRPPAMRLVLTTLLNELSRLTTDVVLVLDDYHQVEAPDIQDEMAFVLDHLPRQLHLVIATRADPALPLARLRARGELVEARAADLRFTDVEASTYLNRTMSLDLAPEEVRTLEQRTEGWIAALQLAALSLQGREDVPAFIADFAGDDRYVVDYLVEEVIQRQPEHVQTFLLKTSVLDRLTASLCDVVTGETGGKSVLGHLERGNLFLVRLDDRRRWWRYHHLFADVLHTRLVEERRDLVPELHRRASGWFEQAGDATRAIRHAIAAHDFDRAADLVEREIPTTLRDRREATLRTWLEMLPAEVVRVRPGLSVGLVGALLSTGQVEGVEQHLDDAERALREAPTDEEPRRLRGWVALYRGAHALVRGDATVTVTSARRAVELLEADDHVGHAAASALIGLSSWGSGDLEAALAAYSRCVAIFEREGYLSDVMGCAVTLADIRIVQGHLGDAMRTYEHALDRATGPDGSVRRGAADMHVGMSSIHLERGGLSAAESHLLLSQELGDHLGLPKNPYRWRVAMSRVRQVQGDLDGAVALLDEAERVFDADFSPDVRPVAASRARVWVAQGRVTDALEWARRQGLTAQDDLTYLHEFEHVTLARVLLADGRLAEAVALLERLLSAADDGRRTGSLIEILVLLALGRQQRGDVAAALVALGRALDLAEPEGYVRVFVDEGAPMRTLLAEAARNGTAPGPTRRLANRFGTAAHGLDPRQPLADPLSARELDVLRLLGTELTGPEIARRLVVSVTTVRTHTQRIYTKLGVTNRRAAVRRADELDLLSRARDRDS